MIKTIYKCDKCSNEQLTDNQFWTISVQAHTQSYQPAFSKNLALQVCRPCLESFGIHVQKDNPDYNKISERTTEDILLELFERIGK